MGAESRAVPWGFAWQAACCFSQLLTLHLTPVIYVYRGNKAGTSIANWRRPSHPARLPAE